MDIISLLKISNIQRIINIALNTIIEDTRNKRRAKFFLIFSKLFFIQQKIIDFLNQHTRIIVIRCWEIFCNNDFSLFRVEMPFIIDFCILLQKSYIAFLYQWLESASVQQILRFSYL